MSAGAARRNSWTGLVLVAVAVGMVGMSFAAVPLYRLFCQVTGFGGTTQTAKAAPAVAGARVFTVRFDANVNSKLPWRFAPIEPELQLRVGAERLAVWRATNLSAHAVTGAATYNVTPAKAGKYFNKVACFCFEEQRLEAGQSVDMAVSFFIDPAIADDPNLAEVKTITLSYTFFRARGGASADEGGGGAK